MLRLSANRFAVPLAIAFALVALLWAFVAFDFAGNSRKSSAAVEEVRTMAQKLEQREKEADQTYWAEEMLAQTCGRTIEALWDEINATSNKLQAIARFPLDEIVLPVWESAQALPHGIEVREPGSAGQMLTAHEWQKRVHEFEREGWRIDSIEFRHTAFDPDANGLPWRSRFSFTANLTQRSSIPQRAVVDGDLMVEWAARASNQPHVGVRRVDASRLKLKNFSGEPFFQAVLNERMPATERSPFIDPLILYDLDGDGLSEIILAGANTVFRRNQDGAYSKSQLCRHPLDFLGSALVADFDRDGHADLLGANWQGLLLFKGSAQGTFEQPPRPAWRANPPLKNVMASTCGDIDQDGDLDLFVGQYKNPALGEVLRPYYYDANDGWPSFLLLNDGNGSFTDGTAAAGLGPKRARRVYGASFVDLDANGHLDLAVVSDFAGLDLYRNDGHGHFTDVTDQWVAEPHAFGMGLVAADFNADGLLDMLMIGMPSPTVDRLQHLNLWRPYSAEDRQRRPAMSFGNRLYLSDPDGGLKQTALNATIARSGWSWGCSVFDFDNDSFPDAYIANGLETKESVREYEPEFWLHDIFVGPDIDDLSATRYFMDKFGRTRGQGWSYGGYDKNRLFLNQRAESFLEVGHLAGVALEQDSRNVASDDLDGDGRMDLVVTTFEAWPERIQTLQVFKNTLNDSGHWIAFRFREESGGQSPVGARVTISCGNRRVTRQIVTGDSHRSQHANTVHFGVGTARQVDSVEIQWLKGPVVRLSGLAVNRYYTVHPPVTPGAR